MKNFILKLFGFSLVIAALDYCWICFAPPENHIPKAGFIVAFFAVITFVFHWLALNAAKDKPQAFVRYYMGSTALRILLYAAIIVAYRFYDKTTLLPFAIGFLVHYFAFSVFEVPTLLKELRKS